MMYSNDDDDNRETRPSLRMLDAGEGIKREKDGGGVERRGFEYMS
jgi:hypothetical protein